MVAIPLGQPRGYFTIYIEEQDGFLINQMTAYFVFLVKLKIFTKAIHIFWVRKKSPRFLNW
ncbi:hypothetical protein AKG95_01185 [Janthinobacterium lividum]|uniref:Uncharacterized protein n=1 Tax=Janthinobacterium lividum TaxID=29581 RepID=A0A1S1UFI2_9BURK|nr:hypothetical protein AKG95_01185 [Janthinobacterium lividum]